MNLQVNGMHIAENIEDVEYNKMKLGEQILTIKEDDSDYYDQYTKIISTYTLIENNLKYCYTFAGNIQKIYFSLDDDKKKSFNDVNNDQEEKVVLEMKGLKFDFSDDLYDIDSRDLSKLSEDEVEQEYGTEYTHQIYNQIFGGDKLDNVKKGNAFVQEDDSSIGYSYLSIALDKDTVLLVVTSHDINKKELFWKREATLYLLNRDQEILYMPLPINNIREILCEIEKLEEYEFEHNYTLSRFIERDLSYCDFDIIDYLKTKNKKAEEEIFEDILSRRDNKFNIACEMYTIFNNNDFIAVNDILKFFEPIYENYRLGLKAYLGNLGYSGEVLLTQNDKYFDNILIEEESKDFYMFYRTALQCKKRIRNESNLDKDGNIIKSFHDERESLYKDAKSLILKSKDRYYNHRKYYYTKIDDYYILLTERHDKDLIEEIEDNYQVLQALDKAE